MKAITGTLFSLLGTVRWIILHEHEKKQEKEFFFNGTNFSGSCTSSSTRNHRSLRRASICPNWTDFSSNVPWYSSIIFQTAVFKRFLMYTNKKSSFFFSLTMTYRADSDIHWPYGSIRPVSEVETVVVDDDDINYAQGKTKLVVGTATIYNGRVEWNRVKKTSILSIILSITWLWLCKIKSNDKKTSILFSLILICFTYSNNHVESNDHKNSSMLLMNLLLLFSLMLSTLLVHW